jgi:hypothetical protein
MKLVTLAPAALTLVAAAAAADTAVYDLPPNNAKETAEAIDNALHAQCGVPYEQGVMSKCRAELLPTGQLLVEAPVNSQAKIAEVIKAIAARGAAPTPRVTLQYWVISGAPGKPDAADPALKPLNPVLQQLEKLHGDLGFKVEDSVMLTTQSGSGARNSGGSFEVTENVRANGDSLNADVQLSFTRMPSFPRQNQPQNQQIQVFQPFQSQLSVSTVLKRGEYVVLGERTFNMPDQSGTLFYVVHWPEAQ